METEQAKLTLYTGDALKPIFDSVAKFCESTDRFNLKSEIEKDHKFSTLLSGIELPLILDYEKNSPVPYIFCGLCTCVRQVVLKSDEKFHYLLGHKGYCLKSVAEASPRVHLVDNLLPKIGDSKEDLEGALNILEQLLAQPSKIHNRDKLQRILLERNRKTASQSEGDKSWAIIRQIGQDNNGGKKRKKEVVASEDLLALLRAFTNGAILSIMDLVCYAFLEDVKINQTDFPHIARWKRIMQTIVSPDSESCLLPTDPPIDRCPKTGEIRIIQNECDYKIETNYKINVDALNITAGNLGKRKKRKLQSEDEKAQLLTTRKDMPALLESLKGTRKLDFYESVDQIITRWDKLETVNSCLQPIGGELKGKRLDNKVGQIQSMSTCIEKLLGKLEDGKRLRLVDFCAGAGHSSLPLAALYPERLEVIILDNKLQSLERAKKRAEKAGLTNVLCVQGNLEQFHSAFDIGIALHACGPATDMVLRKCTNAKASFVVVPCCYGRIATLATTSDLTGAEEFPKCKALKEVGITREEFCLITRGADMDQAKTAKLENLHEEARMFMRIVDWDRMLSIQDVDPGYECNLYRMFPENCATKNHILYGLKLES